MNEKFSNVIPLKSGKCPICGKASAKAFRLFCSKRCADIDLGNWLNEDYRIPLVLGEFDDDEVEE